MLATTFDFIPNMSKPSFRCPNCVNRTQQQAQQSVPAGEPARGLALARCEGVAWVVTPLTYQLTALSMTFGWVVRTGDGLAVGCPYSLSPMLR